MKKREQPSAIDQLKRLITNIKSRKQTLNITELLEEVKTISEHDELAKQPWGQVEYSIYTTPVAENSIDRLADYQYAIITTAIEMMVLQSSRVAQEAIIECQWHKVDAGREARFIYFQIDRADRKISIVDVVDFHKHQQLQGLAEEDLMAWYIACLRA